MHKLFIKSCVLICIVLALQFLVARSPEIPNELKLIDVYCRHDVDIIYMGDSTINWAAVHDINRNDMPILLNLLLPRAIIGKVTHASYNMDVYAAYVDYIVRKNYHPRFVIIPINLRSFSAEWDRQPSWQFAKEKFIAHYKDTMWMKFYQPLAVMRLFTTPISQYEYQMTKVYNGSQEVGRVKDFDNPGFKYTDEEHLKKKLISRYMYDLKPENRKIIAMRHVARVLRDHGITAIFYITPIDVQTGIKALGGEFATRLGNNINCITTTLNEENTNVLNLSAALPTNNFAWIEDNKLEAYPNEHLNLKGKMFVVKNLVNHTPLKNFVPSF